MTRETKKEKQVWTDLLNEIVIDELKTEQTEITPEMILNEAEEKYGVKKFTVLFSGGKDSLTTAHMLSKMGKLHEVLYCNTGIGLKDNFDFVLKTCDKFGWKLNIEFPKPERDYEWVIQQFGFPKEKHHHIVMNNLKWNSMRSYLRKHKGEHIALTSGRRLKESARRKFQLKYTMKPIWKEGSMIIVAPLFYMKTETVLKYVKDNNLERCPVYEYLHTAGDCLCGCFFDKGDAEIIAIFYPEMAKRLSDLEKKYGGKWGRHVSSMTGARTQTTLDKDLLACSDCYIDANIKGD